MKTMMKVLTFMRTAKIPINMTKAWNTSVQITAFNPPCKTQTMAECVYLHHRRDQITVIGNTMVVMKMTVMIMLAAGFTEATKLFV